ncbi:MAG: hypothetical protein IJ243_11330 [Prevotella sp.]|nr:hypothetical protein [Prevotella sp.]
MKTRPVITSILFVAAALVTAGCSKDTIWEEATYGQEEPSYSYGELPAMVQPHTDRVDITLYKDLTHYIYLDGVLVKTLAKEKKMTLRALTPGTEYHLLITAFDGVKVLKRETTFTTPKSYATLIGWREMDLYGNNEEEIGYIRQLPGGDFLDFTHRYYYYSDEDYRLRRTDADGRVKWRSNIAATEASVSEEGNVAVWSQTAYKVNPGTGVVIYQYTPKLKEGFITAAYACKDGGMAIVGRGETPGTYYFARLDADGRLIHEESSDLADRLDIVHETADGQVVALGRKGGDTLVAVTFDASGKVVGTSSDHSEDRGFDLDLDFIQSVRDNQGNTYFLGHYEMYAGAYYPCSMIVKVDAQGQIEWMHTMHDKNTEYHPTHFYLIDNDKLCVLYTGNTGSRNSKTHVALMTTGNEWLQDVTFNDDYAALYVWPVNDAFTQFIFFDHYGRILYIDTEGE